MKKQNSIRLRRALASFSVIVLMFSQSAPVYATIVDNQVEKNTTITTTEESSSDEGAQDQSTPVDLTALNQVITDIKNLNENEYTPDSWIAANLAQLLAQAEELLKDTTVTQEKVNQMVANLNEGLAKLVARADKQDLGNKLTTAKKLKQDDFTPNSWTAADLAKWIPAAETVNNDLNASQTAVDAMAGDLKAAMNKLVFRANKTVLSGKIQEAKKFHQADYTAASFAVLQNAITEGEKILGDHNATADQVQAAINTIVKGIAGLQKPAPEKDKDKEPTTNNRPNNTNNNQQKPTNPSKPAANKKPSNTTGNTNQSSQKEPVVQGPSTAESSTLDDKLVTDSLTDSDLNGFELPLLSALENDNQAGLVSEALKQLSKPYEANAKGDKAFSNLYLPIYLYKTVFNYDLGDSYQDLAQTGKAVDLTESKLGDLLFWEKAGQPTKVAMYLGEGKYIMVDDDQMTELEKVAAEVAKKAAEEQKEKGTADKKTEDQADPEEEEVLAGVRIYTLQGYQKDAQTNKVTIDEEKAKAALAEKAEGEKAAKAADLDQVNGKETDPISLLEETFDQQDNPTTVRRVTEKLELTKHGQEAVKSYAASVDFRVNANTQQFIDSLAEDARELGLKYDVFASVMIAQAILETGSGGSTLSQAPHYNLFGIKGSHRGKSVNMATMEDKGNGSLYQISANFRSYTGFKDSLSDYVQLLRSGIVGDQDFYKAAWRSEAKNYLQATDSLTGKYATDTKYNNKLNSIIAAYNLTQYDEPKEADMSGTDTSMIIQSRSAIPAYYRDKMIFPDYNGKDYNRSGSYPVGQCTWYVFNRIQQLGGIVDDFMGNGGEWGTRGSRLGYRTSQTPRVGYAVSFHPGIAGSSSVYGHVAFVEAVGENGILVSEGNVVGPKTVSYRIIPNSIARSANVTYVAPK